MITYYFLNRCDHGLNEIVMKTLYMQQLDPVWTDKEFSTATGLYATVGIVLGAALGGFLADRFGRRLILTVGYGGYALTTMIFAARPDMWNERWFAMFFLLSHEVLGAVGAVGFLSLAMRISWTKSAAIVFTTYMTLSNISHIIGNVLAAPMRTLFKFGDYDSQAANMFSYELTFWFVGLVTLLPLLLLIWVRTEEIDHARIREAERAGQSS